MSLYDFLVDFFYYCTTEKNFSNRDSKGVWNAQELAIICSKHLFISETVILPTIWQGWLRLFETFFSHNKIFFIVFLRNNFCVYTNKYWFDFDFFLTWFFFLANMIFFWKLLDGFEQPDKKTILCPYIRRKCTSRRIVGFYVKWGDIEIEMPKTSALTFLCTVWYFQWI